MFKVFFLKIPKTSLIILSLAGILHAGVIIADFHGLPGFNQVLLKWTTENEVNLKGFEVQRSFEDNESSFKPIDFVEASTVEKEKNEYTYEDKTVFKGSDRIFYYRLKIVDKDDSFTFSKKISVVPTVSSARQTWGSIKAMFR